MAVLSYLEVDVNGEETFMVDKRMILSFSGKLRNLFGKFSSEEMSNTPMKVILPNFPGGPENFELMLRFCYNNGRVGLSPSNVIPLYFACSSMELEDDVLKAEIEKSFQGLSFWTWSEILLALKQCQDLLHFSKGNASIFISHKLLKNLILRLFLPSFETPYTSSSSSSSDNSSSSKFSCDSRNTSQISTWWFEDLMFLNSNLLEQFIKMMITQKFNYVVISKFLITYQKSRQNLDPIMYGNVLNIVINLLFLLERSSLSLKGLFNMYQTSLRLNLRGDYKEKLEILIGSELDRATVDYLLIPSPNHRKGYKYDVDFVLRLVKYFARENKCSVSSTKLKRVASLMGSYLMEVAADLNLEFAKFASLAMALPNSRREEYSNEKIFLAIDLYFHVHVELSEEMKMGLCFALNYDEMPIEALKDVAQNTKLPKGEHVSEDLMKSHLKAMRLDKIVMKSRFVW